MIIDTSYKAFNMLIKYLKPWRFKIVLASTYSILNKVFDLAPEILIGVAVDLVVTREASFVASLGYDTATSQMVFLGVLTFLIWALESLFQYLYMITWKNLSQDIEHDIRIDAYSHVQNLDVNWYENQHMGNITAILNDDVNQLERFLDTGVNDIIQITVSTLIVGAIFFYISPLIACFSILPIPIILIIAFLFQKNLSPRYTAVRESAGLISSVLFNNLVGIQTIKSFIKERAEVDRVRKISRKYQKTNIHAIKLSSAFVPLVRMGVLTGFLGTMIIGGFKSLNGEIAVGSYSVLVFLTQRFLWPFTSLGEIVDLFERSMASTKRILDTLDFQPSIKDGLNKDFSNFDQSIAFKSIQFYYNKQNIVFNDISFTVQNKKITAIVGPTGIGKTSLVKLLLRFYEPQKGDVLIGNESIKNLELQKLRQNIGLVGQDTFLFDGTIQENIIYPEEDVDSEKMNRVAELSQSYEFIQDFDKGFDTLIGERGVKLSGGQKQRLAIARALYKDPSILVFDEATSSIDNHTESLIQKSMKDICKDRTALIIAHRLSTIRYADNIIVIDKGKIAEEGNHEELLLKNGLYKKLWDIQTGVVTD